MKYGKVAICLSGLLRTGIQAHKCFQTFFSQIEEYDVFYHVWEEPKEVLDQLSTLYKPVSCVVVSPKNSLSSTNIVGEGSFGNSLYSMMIANELKKKHEIENGFRYNLVIRTRFDLAFPVEARFPVFNMFPRTIYAWGIDGRTHTDYDHHGMSDIIFWGDSEAMDIATNCYMYYKYEALPFFEKSLQGVTSDPKNYLYSVGNLIYDRTIKRNIAHQHYTDNFKEVPWRTDVRHLDPFTQYDKIRERYNKNEKIDCSR